jgi:hypothetical protein
MINPFLNSILTLVLLSYRSQNLKLGTEDVCDDEGHVCCSTRTGFFEAYNTPYKEESEAELRKCAAKCESPDECVVLTGHSQGGAIAAVAALYFADLNPYVITFGQPATIDAPCPMITSERWYRWVNTKDLNALARGIVYDPVPFAPGLGADNFGHMILLGGADSSGVAYIGLDAQDAFGISAAGIDAHNMRAAEGSLFPGYLDRIDAIMEAYAKNGTYPIRTNGYLAGSLCSADTECETGDCAKELSYSYRKCVGTDCDDDTDCETGRCDSGICLPKLGTCQKCDENSDCESGTCTWRFLCAATSDGLMDDNCECNRNSDCISGRCEGYTPPICEAQLGLDAACNEGSDCLSGYCSWSFVCAESTWTWKGSPPEDGPPEDDEKSTPVTGVAVAGLVVVGLLLWCLWRKCRRGDYEEVATTDTA